eukprot:scaffold18987_cov109-Isochrysis_galbana.AAC.11
MFIEPLALWPLDRSSGGWVEEGARAHKVGGQDHRVVVVARGALDAAGDGARPRPGRSQLEGLMRQSSERLERDGASTRQPVPPSGASRAPPVTVLLTSDLWLVLRLDTRNVAYR